MKLFLLIFCSVWTLLGAVFLIVGYSLQRSYQNRCKTLRGTADGVIADLQLRDGSFFPVVEYSVNGVLFRRTMHVGSSRCAYQRGDAVRVRYDPERPQRFALEGDKLTNTVGKVFLWVGGGCLTVEMLTLGICAFIQTM